MEFTMEFHGNPLKIPWKSSWNFPWNSMEIFHGKNPSNVSEKKIHGIP
jgi:hypothetical protein